ncbi:adenine-specific methyltransferase EcoRI family protein, partial [Treponema sp.]|uniref:adenine-specific methyltransferase EcoRI family protein n=1 Tax=Treponema sp. TaxID=166 RepID=UPI003FA2ADD2
KRSEAKRSEAKRSEAKRSEAEAEAELRNAQLMPDLSSGTRCNGIMGVPISFLDKYCPEQFEIIGLDRYVADNPNYGHRFTISGRETYARILIRHLL